MMLEKQKELEAMLEAEVGRLAEHFEAVQIVASVTRSDGTRFFKRGNGNWYARLAMCQQFIKDTDHIDQAEDIAQRVNPPDDGEKWKA